MNKISIIPALILASSIASADWGTSIIVAPHREPVFALTYTITTIDNVLGKGFSVNLNGFAGTGANSTAAGWVVSKPFQFADNVTLTLGAGMLWQEHYRDAPCAMLGIEVRF